MFNIVNVIGSKWNSMSTAAKVFAGVALISCVACTILVHFGQGGISEGFALGSAGVCFLATVGALALPEKQYVGPLNPREVPLMTGSGSSNG